MRYAKETLRKIEEARAKGADIVENKNAFFKGTRGGWKCVEKLAQTNSRTHGFPVRVVWACYR
jgi:hypothetical protein